MATEIKLPKLGETMEEGLITRWLVKEGDRIVRGQPIFEVQTDKVNIEYESPAEGVLLKILVPPDQTVPVLTPVAYVGAEGEEMPAATAPSSPPPNAEGKPSEPEPGAVSTAAPPANPGVKEGERVLISPRARRLAREAGLDPREIAGSGPGGRVIAADVEARVQCGASRATAPAPSSGGGERRVPLSRMRQIIARRLTESFTTIPHFYLKATADATDLMNMRADLNAERRGGEGRSDLSVTDLILRACVLALQEFPELNAALDGNELVLHSSIDLGVAVALEDGLIVPVIRGAERLDLFALSRRVRDLVERAKGGRLSPDECSGGTFTVSNLGMYGVDEFSAIINPPEVAILAVGRVMPCVTAQGAGFAVRQSLAMTLSCDHRAIDGVTGARFLARLSSLLAAPHRLVMP
ncbi:MAG: dihydrolipoamide acetyltransferase family protein [Patescibacteria group bacterium]